MKPPFARSLVLLLILSACGSTNDDTSRSGGPNTNPVSTSDAGSDGSAGVDGGTDGSTTPSVGADGETTPIDCAITKCLYVTADGSGAKNGSDWANAFAKLPSKLVRGAAYWLAGGTYGDHTFDDPASDAKTITIKRATETDHGTNTGWMSTYGDGQATFTGWVITADGYVFDGARRNTDWRTGGLDRYGITTGNTRLDDGNGKGGDNLTFRRIDFHGGGRDTGDGDDVIYGLTGNSNLTFQSCALHDSDRTIFLMRDNWKSLTVDRSYLARNTSSPAVHGELLSMTESDGVVFSNNAIEDIEGTAVFAGLNNGLAQHWKIYGNTVVHTAAYIADTGRKAGHNFGVAGFVFCGNDTSNDNTCNDFLTCQNTLVNIQGTWSGVVIQKGTGNIVQNNLWYKSVQTNHTGVTTGYNWYFDTTTGDDDSATKEVCTSSCDVFVDLANRDFHLATDTSPGTVLPAPFAIDPDGVARGAGRGWDRGAFDRP